MDDKTHEFAVLKAQAAIRLEELKAQDSAKEVAGKAIGENGLLPASGTTNNFFLVF